MIIFIITVNLSIFSYADDEIEEADITPEEIQEILEVTAEANTVPSINSRYAVVFDRTSRKSIIWEKRKYKM